MLELHYPMIQFLIMRIIFSLGRELIFAVSRIYCLSYNTLQSLRSTLKTLQAEKSLQREFQGGRHCRGRNERGSHLFLRNLKAVLSSMQKWWGFLDRGLDMGGFHVTSSPPCLWMVNKRSLISSLWLSTSICSFHHCNLCLPRLHENHL